jgi:hypothetical protein
MASFFFTHSLGGVETFSHFSEGFQPLTLFRGVETPRNNFGRAYGTCFMQLAAAYSLIGRAYGT